MELSRKRQRELKKLRRQAGDVWDEQREVLERAASILRDASRHAASVAREDVAPRVRETYEKRIVPGVEAGVGSVRHAASATRDRFVDDVMPAVSGAIGSAIAVLDVARDKRVRDAIRQVSASGRELATRAGPKGGHHRGEAEAGTRPLHPHWLGRRRHGCDCPMPPGRRCAPTTICGLTRAMPTPRRQPPRSPSSSRLDYTSSTSSGVVARDTHG